MRSRLGATLASLVAFAVLAALARLALARFAEEGVPRFDSVAIFWLIFAHFLALLIFMDLAFAPPGDGRTPWERFRTRLRASLRRVARATRPLLKRWGVALLAGLLAFGTAQLIIQGALGSRLEVLAPLQRFLGWMNLSLYRSLGDWGIQIWFVLINLPAVAIGLLAGLAISRRAQTVERELHCLKCDYILKGLVEPRCPECGASI